VLRNVTGRDSLLLPSVYDAVCYLGDKVALFLRGMRWHRDAYSETRASGEIWRKAKRVNVRSVKTRSASRVPSGPASRSNAGLNSAR
jgi:hypothetical protein